MPDKRRHRGPNPLDKALFGPRNLPLLATALFDLSWLLGRGYSTSASLTLVGDHYQLRQRQRIALRRMACSPLVARERQGKRVSPAGRSVAVDAFNLVVTVEAALSGALILRGTDGWPRDISSVHGSYRCVRETRAALGLLSSTLEQASRVRWILDRPVSNSGRLRAMILELGHEAELADSADGRIARLCNSPRQPRQEPWVAATADGPLLDRVEFCSDLVTEVLRDLSGVWMVDLA